MKRKHGSLLVSCELCGFDTYLTHAFGRTSTGTFSTQALQLCLYEQNVYAADEQGKVKVYTHQGTVKQLLAFTEVEGNPCFIDVCNKFLIVATTNGYLRLYDLARRCVTSMYNDNSHCNF